MALNVEVDVNKEKTKSPIKLVVTLVVVLALVGLSYFAVGLYRAFNDPGYDDTPQKFLQSVALAEEAYFVEHGQYTRHYGKLANYGLAYDDGLVYGPIVVTPGHGAPNFRVTVNAKGGIALWGWDSRDLGVKRMPGEPLAAKDSAWDGKRLSLSDPE